MYHGGKPEQAKGVVATHNGTQVYMHLMSMYESMRVCIVVYCRSMLKGMANLSTCYDGHGVA